MTDKAMPIHLYNSLSRRKEPLPLPQEQKKIRLFVCGPTVYDYAHIGHARTYIFFDFFAKYLRSQGYDVDYLQNITDIDDKIIKRAAENNEKPEQLAKKFTEAYFEDMKSLGVDAVTRYAPATGFITQIVAQVERLIEKGFAYKIDGDGWYFDISKDKDYGKLSGRTAEQAEDSVSRIDEAVGKKNKGDFALWKFSKPGGPSWNTPLDPGRPGWHIEDTAITEYYFGPQYDIHGGGVDLKFPHHEAEIAQQESASGLTPFVKIWMHTGALLVEGKKMSKSVGNFITVREFLKKYSPEVLRLLVFNNHYRSPVDYGEKALQDAAANWNNIRYFFYHIDFAIEKKLSGMDRPTEWPTLIQAALGDDINIPAALAVIFHAINDTNTLWWQIDYKSLQKTKDFIEKQLTLFGLMPEIQKIPLKIDNLAHKREQFRANKQFAQSDALRKEIDGLGYEVEDTPKGPFVWPKL